MALQKCFSQFWWFLEIFTPVWKILKYNKQKHWSTCLDPNSPWYFQIQNMRFRFWLPDPSLILSTTTTIESIQSSSIVNTTKCGTESHGSKFSYIIRGQHQNSWGHQRSHGLRSLHHHTHPFAMTISTNFKWTWRKIW